MSSVTPTGCTCTAKCHGHQPSSIPDQMFVNLAIAEDGTPYILGWSHYRDPLAMPSQHTIVAEMDNRKRLRVEPEESGAQSSMQTLTPILIDDNDQIWVQSRYLQQKLVMGNEILGLRVEA